MTMRSTLTLIVTAASPARHIGSLVTALRLAGWSVSVLPTHSAITHFRSEWPSELDRHLTLEASADPARVVVAPATYHMIGRLASGSNDTPALQLLNRMLGRCPTLILPHVDSQLAANPLLHRHLRILSDAGIETLPVVPCEGGCSPEAHWPHLTELIGSPR